MNSPVFFPSHQYQRPVPDESFGTLAVQLGKDKRDTLQLRLSVPGGRAKVTTAPSTQVKAAAKALDKVADALHETVTNWTDAHPDSRQSTVNELRAKSRELAELVFPTKTTEQREDRSRFIAALKCCEIVQFETDEISFSIPWNLLWLDDEDCWSGEMVMFCRIYDFVPRSFDETRFAKKGCSTLGYVEDDRLSSARADLDAPLARNEELWAAHRLVGTGLVDTLKPLGPNRLSLEDIDDLNQWLSKPRNFLHFNCHSEGVGEEDEFSDFGLRRQAIATAENLQHVRGGAAAFLNICRSAVHALDDDLGLSAAIHSRGARAVCATTHLLSDRFATLFVRTVYKGLANENYNLFRALRKAQRKMMRSLDHPMALFYVFEGDANFVIGEG
jgi:hypothetical protein